MELRQDISNRNKKIKTKVAIHVSRLLIFGSKDSPSKFTGIPTHFKAVKFPSIQIKVIAQQTSK